MHFGAESGSGIAKDGKTTQWILLTLAAGTPHLSYHSSWLVFIATSQWIAGNKSRVASPPQSALWTATCFAIMTDAFATAAN